MFWLGVAVLTWVYLTPTLAAMKTFEMWWITTLLAQILILVGLLFGAMHYFFVYSKSQGDRLRFTTKPFPTNNRLFKFSHQVHDNVFHTLVYGVPVMKAYEVITNWLFANSYIGFIDLTDPITFWGWFVCPVLFAPVIHSVHFYCGHRLLHVKLLYKHVHSLHHTMSKLAPGPGFRCTHWSTSSISPPSWCSSCLLCIR